MKKFFSFHVNINKLAGDTLSGIGIGAIVLAVGLGIAGWILMTFHIDTYWINLIKEIDA